MFQGVEAFKWTYLTALAAAHIQAYDKIVDCGSTVWLGDVSANLRRRSLKAEGLVHLMITFDDGPCYETVCRSFRIEEG